MIKNPFSKVDWYMKPILPLVYEDSISYMETLNKLMYKINELIEYINALDTTYIDEQIKILRDYVNANVDALNGRIEWIKNYTDAEISANQLWVKNYVENAIREFTSTIESQIVLIYQVLNKNNEELKKWVSDEWEKFKDEIPDLTTVYVINPVTNETTTIQVALDDMWASLRYDSLTAGEYDGLRLTASRYDNLKIMAYDYDIHGRTILLGKKENYMYSPFTGEFVTVREVVSMLADLHKTDVSIDATAYDALLLTATAYDSKNITAYNYDWKSKELLSA